MTGTDLFVLLALWCLVSPVVGMVLGGCVIGP